ncbi:hypothetical protein Pelo_10220 [Pelomyxa schiedti]|nr:hypothetical protein Pelo_10220 [Pelomyxa schiedti]
MQRGRPQTRVPTGINRQQRRPQAAQQPNRSVPRRRPAWDTSVHDLKAYKATPEELRLRREQRVSANLAAAREDLRNRRLKPKLVEEPICACEEDSTGPEEYYDDEFYSENETEESGCSCGHNCREDASESGNEDVEYETPSRGEHSTGGDWLPQGFRPSTTRTPKVRTTAITYVGAVDKISPPAPSQSLLSKKRDKFAQDSFGDIAKFGRKQKI